MGSSWTGIWTGASGGYVGLSCMTEPLACRTGRCLQVANNRIEINCRTTSWGQRMASCGKKPTPLNCWSRILGGGAPSQQGVSQQAQCTPAAKHFPQWWFKPPTPARDLTARPTGFRVEDPEPIGPPGTQQMSVNERVSKKGTSCLQTPWVSIIHFFILVSKQISPRNISIGKISEGDHRVESSDQARISAESWPHPSLSAGHLERERRVCSSVHGTSQAKTLEWVAISFSRGSSQPRNQTHVSCISRHILNHWTTWEALWKSHTALSVLTPLPQHRSKKFTFLAYILCDAFLNSANCYFTNSFLLGHQVEDWMI